MPEQPAFPGVPIPQTPVARPYRHPQEVTVQFRRWTQVGMTAYQKGQCAGFLRPQAEEMQRKGMCIILNMAEPPAPAADGAKTKAAAA
jgi:hypothetical protein